MNPGNNLYREEADFLLRESMNKLKGMVDLLALGVFEHMNRGEQDEFVQKMRLNLDTLYGQLSRGIRYGAAAKEASAPGQGE